MCWSILGGWRCYSDIPEQAMSRHSHESTYFSRTRILDEDNNTEKIPHPLISLRVSKHILAAGPSLHPTGISISSPPRVLSCISTGRNSTRHTYIRYIDISRA
ncbi:hypothetical protein EYR41_003440 [Orbilia oligospora]|uniref:Uncharacterized protein n=1 Tax=Orbilia oligospora TaxID=2813651 RepID=A0A8H2HUB7_ORBOL|nr:hypothetical protein EYR41_003440 [Orbilia oligospora]